MPIDRLPTPEEGLDGLLRLAEAFGIEETFLFLGMVRDDRGPSQPGGQARVILARQLVEAEGGDPNEARKVVAERLGYNNTTRTNFYKLVQGITRGGATITE